MKAYPKTKPSGVEWLGEVPEHWEVKRLSFLATLQSGENITSEMIAEGGDYPVYGGNGYRGNYHRFTHRGHFALIGRQGALCGNINYARGEFWASEHALVVTPLAKIETTWMGELLRAMNLGQYSVTAAQPGISAEVIRALRIPVPPPDEQTAIAAYLDRETGRIDELVGKKRDLIERLKEKRTALISRTVTRGLPADLPPPTLAKLEALAGQKLPLNPPLKPSGIDWLGDLPEHWEVAQLRRKAEILDCKHRTVPFIDDGIPLASIREVHGFEVDLTNAKQTSEDEFLALIEGGRKPRKGDIIYSRNATVGDAALVTTTERFCMGQDVCLIRAPKHHPKFLLYLLRSEPLMEQVESLMIGSTFRRINVGQIHGFWICVPPLPEQRAIAAYLDEETAKLDALVAKVETAIERLQEYRTALITAAVTGKIDVRDHESAQ